MRIIRWSRVEGVDCEVDTRASEILAAVNNPLKSGYDYNDRKSSDAIVYSLVSLLLYNFTSRGILTHAAPGHSAGGREDKENSRQGNIGQGDLILISILFRNLIKETHNICDPSENIGKLPLSLGEGLAALQAIDEDRHRIGQVKGHDGGRNNRIEGTFWSVEEFKVKEGQITSRIPGRYIRNRSPRLLSE